MFKMWFELTSCAMSPMGRVSVFVKAWDPLNSSAIYVDEHGSSGASAGKG